MHVYIDRLQIDKSGRLFKTKQHNITYVIRSFRRTVLLKPISYQFGDISGGYLAFSGMAKQTYSNIAGELRILCARVRRPAQMDDPQQVIDFVGPMTGFSRDARMRVFVVFPPSFIGSAREPVALIEAFGFALGEISTFVVLNIFVSKFMVLTGVASQQDLPEVAPGIRSVGEGEDFAQDLENRSLVRQFGRPFRIAERDERIGISLEAAPLVAWSDGSAIRTLADDDSLLAIAQLLDERNVVSATIHTLEPGRANYEAVGIGWNEDDDGP
jgi:hypothetical protein